MRPIDADYLTERLNKLDTMKGIGLEPVMAMRDVKALISVMPTVDAAPLDDLSAMLSTIGADINCYYCRKILGECTQPPDEREYECDSMAHWAAFLKGWWQKYSKWSEEQDAKEKG